MRRVARRLVILLATIGAAILALLWTATRAVDRRLNRVAGPRAAPNAVDITQEAAQPAVVDLHADTLLWPRNPLHRHRAGHIDLPRLDEGGVALQVFAAVTRVPLGANLHETARRADVLPLLVMGQGWPRRTWRSPLYRALYQAERLERYAAHSQGRLFIVRSVPDLEMLLARRATMPRPVGAMLALEGAHALQGNLANLERLYVAGYRLLGLTHLFDNGIGGSGQGIERGGLTAFGEQVVRRAQDWRMLIDLAHASPRLIDDVLRITTAPLIVSHTGLNGVVPNRRNLSDAQARAIAATGGVIGLTLFEAAVGDRSIDAVVRAIRYGAELVGVEHIAVGSDFDGTVITPFDAAGWPKLAAALRAAGLTEREVALILGGNALRVLRACLPRA